MNKLKREVFLYQGKDGNGEEHEGLMMMKQLEEGINTVDKKGCYILDMACPAVEGGSVICLDENDEEYLIPIISTVFFLDGEVCHMIVPDDKTILFLPYICESLTDLEEVESYIPDVANHLATVTREYRRGERKLKLVL